MGRDPVRRGVPGRERTIADLRARLAASEAASNRPVASPGDGGGESSPNEVETKPRRATRAERRTDERKERIGALERDLKAARRALEAGESDKAKLAADLRELERENLALSRDTSALRTARRELDAALEDRAQLTRRLARAESSLEQERAASRERAESRPGRRDQRLREAMKGLEGELGDARRALERSESERSRLAADLEDLEQRNRRLSDDTTALSAARADLATAERDRDQLARQLERVESDLERERSAARTRNARSEKRANPKKSELRRTIEELENENARLARERDDLDLRNRELAADAAALDLAQRDLAAARAYGNELVKRLADLELETLRREPPAAQVAVDAERALPIEPLVAEMPDPVARTDPSEIEAVARSWAAAWSSQSVADYLAFYSDAFVPANGMDLTAWRAQRRQRLSRPEFIRVEIRDLETRIDGPERATIVFRQSYQSDTYSDDVEKTLELARLDGSWKILSERAR